MGAGVEGTGANLSFRRASTLDKERVPIRFSVTPAEQRALRIRAAMEDLSVPDLMRAIVADYLTRDGQKT